MPSLADNLRKTWKLPVLFAAALALAVAARRLYAAGQRPASLTLLAGALAVCGVILYRAGPRVLGWKRFPRLRIPWNYRLTREGALYITAVLVVAAAALISANNLLYLVLSSMLSAMLVSGLVSRLVLSGLELQVVFPEHVFCGRDASAQVSLRNLKRWIPSFSIWVAASGEAAGSGLTLDPLYCPVIGGAETLKATTRSRFPRRGLFQADVYWLKTKFPFSFVERRAALRPAKQITVYPDIRPCHEDDELLRLLGLKADDLVRGESHDLYRLRPALPDDGARFVDWKATARSGELFVREFTRDDVRRVEVRFERTVPAGAPAWLVFETAVRRCAATCFQLDRLGVEIRFESDEVSITSRPNSPGVYEILRYLAVVNADAGARGGASEIDATSRNDRGLPEMVFRAEASGELQSA